MTAWAAVVVYVFIVPARENIPWNKSKYSDNKKLIKNNIKGQHKEEEIHKSSEQEEVEKFYQSVPHRFDRDDESPKGPGYELRY